MSIEGEKSEKQQSFIELRAKGSSYDSIAKAISVSKPTLMKWSRELEMELTNYKAIEVEALREEHLASKKHRIISQGEQLKAMREELSKRDLSDIPTYKLIELIAKLSDNLADDEPIHFTASGTRLGGFTHQWLG